MFQAFILFSYSNSFIICTSVVIQICNTMIKKFSLLVFKCILVRAFNSLFWLGDSIEYVTKCKPHDPHPKIEFDFVKKHIH